jgi:four helix bundle protein
MAYQSFEDLEVWQRGCRLTVAVFKAFRICKEFTLKDQIQRAALSIPSNVAEGAERGSNKDFAHFLNIAKGRAANCERSSISHASSIPLRNLISTSSLLNQNNFRPCSKGFAARSFLGSKRTT